MNIKNGLITGTFLACWSLFFLGCHPQQTSVSQPSTRWDSLVNSFIHDSFEHRPTFGAASGDHRYDGRLPDFSRAGLAAQVELLKTYLKKIDSIDTTTLTPAQQFERQYLLSEIEEDIFWIAKAKRPFNNPAYYFGALSPSRYITFDYAPEETRFRALIQHLTHIPPAILQIKENMPDTLPATFSKLGAGYFGGLAAYFESDVPEIFKSVDNDSLQTAFGQASQHAIEACRGMGVWFAEKKVNDDYAMGSALFSDMLYATERVGLPLKTLKKLGERDLRRNTEALEAACKALDPTKTVAECVALVQAQKPASGPVAAAEAQLLSLKQFLTDHNIVSIPGTESCLVAEAPPYRRSNSAYIEIPGPYEENVSSTYYIAPPDPAWTAAEQQQYIPGEADLLFISAHEVWPGHFLQFLHSNRSPRMVGRLFIGYAFAEGWAHYAEEMMYDAGLEKEDPAMHIGQLLNALLRNVRYLSAIGLHTEGMTVAESEQMFKEYAFQDPGNARQQAARGTYDPAYLNYTLGKLLIMQLGEEWLAKTHGSLKEFHDQFLSYGGPPIPLITQAMLRDQESL